MLVVLAGVGRSALPDGPYRPGQTGPLPDLLQTML